MTDTIKRTGVASTIADASRQLNFYWILSRPHHHGPIHLLIGHRKKENDAQGLPVVLLAEWWIPYLGLGMADADPERQSQY